jgi:hypothetical protein
VWLEREPEETVIVRAFIVNEEPGSTTELASANCGKQQDLRKTLPRRRLIVPARGWVHPKHAELRLSASGPFHAAALSFGKQGVLL